VDIGDQVKPPYELDVLHPCSDIHGMSEHKYTFIHPENTQKINGHSISIYPS
jgi:hypothetical protein